MIEEQICLVCDKKFTPYDKKRNHICLECTNDPQRKEYCDVLDISNDIICSLEPEVFDDTKWRDLEKENLV